VTDGDCINRIHLARGFTAYHHYGTVCNLPAAVNQSIRESTDNTGPRGRQPTGDDDSSPHTPSLIVVPAVDAQYRADDILSEAHTPTQCMDYAWSWRAIAMG